MQLMDLPSRVQQHHLWRIDFNWHLQLTGSQSTAKRTGDIELVIAGFSNCKRLAPLQASRYFWKAGLTRHGNISLSLIQKCCFVGGEDFYSEGCKPPWAKTTVIVTYSTWIPAQWLIQYDPYIANYRLSRQFLFKPDQYLISLLPIGILTLVWHQENKESCMRPKHLVAAPGEGRWDSNSWKWKMSNESPKRSSSFLYLLFPSSPALPLLKPVAQAKRLNKTCRSTIAI